MKLYLATGNPHKIVELQAMLAAANLDIEVRPPSEIGGMPDVEEDEDTFSGNALKKARALAALLPDNGLAMADDSGLCVDALGGAPGVFSARYAGDSATDEQNCSKLLEALDGIEDMNRAAAFECHIAVVAPNGEEHVFIGQCRGHVVRKKRGSSGFGYDPLFQPDDFDSTFAEMGPEQKAELSHRGAAIRKFVKWLSPEPVDSA